MLCSSTGNAGAGAGKSSPHRVFTFYTRGVHRPNNASWKRPAPAGIEIVTYHRPISETVAGEPWQHYRAPIPSGTRKGYIGDLNGEIHAETGTRVGFRRGTAGGVRGRAAGAPPTRRYARVPAAGRGDRPLGDDARQRRGRPAPAEPARGAQVRGGVRRRPGR